MASAKMTVWGDPATATRMAESFFKGQQFGYLADGLMNNMPDGIKDALGQAGNALQQMATSATTPNGDTPQSADGEAAPPARKTDRH